MLDVLCVGHASYDISMALSHHPEPDEKSFADAMQLAGGGPAANAAVCVSRLGGVAGFCGYLGNDLFGEAHVREFRAEGVEISNLVRGEDATPVSQILAKPDGHRSVVNYKGDSVFLEPDAVSISERPKVLLFDGHEPLLSLPLCRWAKEQGIITVLDAGSLHQGTRELTTEVDYLVASETFARHCCETDDLTIALHRLSKHCEHVVITQGDAGLIWNCNGETGAMDAFNVDVVDSTGAGDAFHGAFALALARDMVWSELLCFASAAGALTCTRLGARCGLPNRGTMNDFLETVHA
ncbi:MAG: PfkB family carbohydrate kinase [Mariprofundus sp.]|nr:PfkB family carbohydrate kinase [Mariprofundus sp.]